MVFTWLRIPLFDCFWILTPLVPCWDRWTFPLLYRLVANRASLIAAAPLRDLCREATLVRMGIRTSFSASLAWFAVAEALPRQCLSGSRGPPLISAGIGACTCPRGCWAASSGEDPPHCFCLLLSLLWSTTFRVVASWSSTRWQFPFAEVAGPALASAPVPIACPASNDLASSSM